MPRPIEHALTGSALMLLLAACGGSDRFSVQVNPGGIESPPFLPPASTGVTVDTAAAWRHYLGTAQRWEVAGQQNGNAFSLALTLTPGPISIFPYNGQLAQTSTESLRLRFAGVASVDTDATLYYSNGSLIGIVGGSGASARCAVIRTPFTALPTNSRVGDSGTIVSLARLAACTPDAQQIGSVTLRWSIEQDLAVTLFCLTSLQQAPQGTPAGAQTACMQTTAQGELGGSARLSVRRPDGSEVSGKNY
ncbi:hypothetical protein [Massilia sp. DWR3-1-1]|uniref:hypothetical protein n=1 Tax=Massilia sp. DWR3-1-1 TaxID=2804559 RepID=UPI003CE87770